MISERGYLAQVQASTPRQFANIIRTASDDSERVLRTYFGDAQFERMHSLSQNLATTPTGTVVLLPGIFGSELYRNGEHIWISPWNIIRGDFDQLQLDASGASINFIRAPGPLKKYYGEIQLALLQRWNVVPFAYDWRLDIKLLARQLKERLDASLPAASNFSIVAHSMGGLVVRSYLQQFPDQVNRVQRFIMLGTPNYGSFAMAALYNGLNHVLKMVALLDEQHYLPDLLQIVKTFVSTYQMLPFSGRSPDAARLKDPAAYAGLNLPQQRLDNATAFQQEIVSTPLTPPGRTTYIAGYGFKTPFAIADWNKLHSWDGYRQTLTGDGMVPHCLGLMDQVTNYFVQAEHSLLAADTRVIHAVEEILTTGTTSTLPTQLPQIGVLTHSMMVTERSTEEVAYEARGHMLREIVRLERQAHPHKISISKSELQDMIFSSAGMRARPTSAGQ